MDPEQRRHHALASLSRSRLLAVLRGAPEPQGVQELARAVALHANTARQHLDQLVEAGLVERYRAAPIGRGRPAFRYALAQDARVDSDGETEARASAKPGVEAEAEAYRALAGVLATELAQRPDVGEAAMSAGERWGHAMAEGAPPTTTAAQALDRLVGLLDEAGFAPEPAVRPDEPIRLRRCPFAELARERRDVVCAVHLGLMRGALRELEAPLDAVRLEPFVAPDLCLAHVAADPRWTE